MSKAFPDVVLALVRQDGSDLSLRQCAVLIGITQTHDRDVRTVRGQAVLLNVPRPVITRAMDRLEESGLARRIADPRDRRSVLLVPTAHGIAMARVMGAMLPGTAEEAVAA